MSIVRTTPVPDALDTIVGVLSSWQRDAALVQLHPGDLGWAWRSGSSAVASSLRVWSEDDAIVAIGFFDGADVFRMTVSPARWSDESLARRLADDLFDPRFSPGPLSLELPVETTLRATLARSGWTPGEAWTPLAHDPSAPTADAPPALTIERVGAHVVSEFTALHRSAWGNARFDDESWQTMADGPAFRDALCLLGRDPTGAAVAGVTVWGAGAGRPAVLEPMGVHAEHRGRRYGTAICLVAAAAARKLGASTAWVCTPSALHSAVATYRSAGFVALPERLDLVRPA
jgi:GNAT superfamily N-acetyltransferase